MVDSNIRIDKTVHEPDDYVQSVGYTSVRKNVLTETILFGGVDAVLAGPH